MKGKTSDGLWGFDVVSCSCAGSGSERKGTGNPTSREGSVTSSDKCCRQGNGAECAGATGLEISGRLARCVFTHATQKCLPDGGEEKGAQMRRW